ncbi:hypothetical protein ACFQ51_17965 [Streptomyces kaempferi]
MTSPHEIDPRALSDPRNVYPTDEQFYAHGLADRPPAGGGPPTRRQPRGTAAPPGDVGDRRARRRIILLILVGIALFP